MQVVSVDELRRRMTTALQSVREPWAAAPHRLLSAGFSSVAVETAAGYVVRAPRTPAAAARSRRMVTTLHALRGRVPAQIPTPEATLPRGANLPFGAVVYAKLEGQVLTVEDATARPRELAEEIAAFLHALHSLTPAAAPDSLPDLPMDTLAQSGQVAAMSPGLLRTGELRQLSRWRQLFAQDSHTAPRVLAHGDFWHGNLLLRNRRLHAVLDWEAAGWSTAAVDLCAMGYLGERFSRHVLKRYAAASHCEETALEASVRRWGVAREMHGVTWASTHHDRAELDESLDKLRDALNAAV